MESAPYLQSMIQKNRTLSVGSSISQVTKGEETVLKVEEGQTVKKHVIMSKRRKKEIEEAEQATPEESNEEQQEHQKEDIVEKFHVEDRAPLIQLTAISLPLLRVQFILYSQYVFSLLYQYGLIPMPFTQLKQYLHKQNQSQSIITDSKQEGRISYRKKLNRQRLENFVTEVESALQTLENWINKEFIENERSDIISTPYLGVGFGPSMNNLKRIFLLHFPSLQSLPRIETQTQTQSETLQINRIKRMFVQKLIEMESEEPSKSSVTTANRLKNGNMFLFMQLPSSNSINLSSDLLEHFYPSDVIPMVSNYLNDYNTLTTHQQKQLKKKISQVTIQWAGQTHQTPAICESSSIRIDSSWLLLRKGVKVLKSASSTFD